MTTVLAIAGTIPAMVWSLTVALSVASVWLRPVLVIACVAPPAVLWTLALRHQTRADRFALWGLSAEFAVMVAVDFIGWIVDANP